MFGCQIKIAHQLLFVYLDYLISTQEFKPGPFTFLFQTDFSLVLSNILLKLRDAFLISSRLVQTVLNLLQNFRPPIHTISLLVKFMHA
jgi:hypothetical protein